ncbi:MAG: metallophosphoesterase family protein [Aristaeellaceae bacterium]
MRYLILADIHGNLPALEAVLASPEASGCDGIISLGDQVNYGPQSREVMQRLTGLHASMLLGNHEERLHRLDDPALAGYNWSLLHWTARQLSGINFAFPIDMRLGPVLFTHGMPGAPYRLVGPQELPEQLDALPEGVQLLMSGHHHIRWDVTHGGKRAVNPGSVGVPEDGIGSVASFAVLTMAEDTVHVTLHRAAYDVHEVARAYLTSGAAQAAPEMTRLILQNMRTGSYSLLLDAIARINALAQPLGLTLADREAWLRADSLLPWTEPLSTPQFWRMMEEKLL